MKNNNNKTSNKKKFTGKDTFSRTPKFTTIKLDLGTSERYDNVLASLVEAIDNCSFDVCAIYAKMKKSLFFNNEEAKGTIDLGEIRSYDEYNRTFEISMPTSAYEKIKEIIDGLYVVPNVRLNKDNGDVRFISSFEVVMQEPLMDVEVDETADEE